MITAKLLYSRNTYTSTIYLSSLSVSTSSLSFLDRLVEANPEKLVLPPDQVVEVPLSFVPHVEDVGKKLKVNLCFLKMQDNSILNDIWMLR